MRKLSMIPSRHNSEVTAYINHISISKIQSLSSFHRKYTKTKYWIEVSEHGHRLCQKSFDANRDEWCKKIIKSSYFPFIAIGFSYGNIRKVWIHDHLHESYIREYLSIYSFDSKQKATIDDILLDRNLFKGF